jgi:energy-coupling factor transport system substrate-specific component
MIMALVSIAGIALFLWPFTGAPLPAETPGLALAIVAVLVVGAVEGLSRRLDSRRLALLASIAGLNAMLRLFLVTGIGGFSPMFLLVLCAGFAFGPSFGFLAGALSMLVSGVATGGVGQYLPYEMFAMAWTGLLAGVVGRFPLRPLRARLLVLAVAGVFLGFVYGGVMDIWDWTVTYRGAPDLGWSPGMPPAAAARAFLRFYLVSGSGVYDAARAAGNAAMVLLVGAPIIAAMQRLRVRFTVTVVPRPGA